MTSLSDIVTRMSGWEAGKSASCAKRVLAALRMPRPSFPYLAAANAVQAHSNAAALTRLKIGASSVGGSAISSADEAGGRRRAEKTSRDDASNS